MVIWILIVSFVLICVCLFCDENFWSLYRAHRAAMRYTSASTQGTGRALECSLPKEIDELLKACHGSNYQTPSANLSRGTPGRVVVSDHVACAKGHFPYGIGTQVIYDDIVLTDDYGPFFKSHDDVVEYAREDVCYDHPSTGQFIVYFNK